MEQTTEVQFSPVASLQIVPDGEDKYGLALDGHVLVGNQDLFGAQWIQADYERRGPAALLEVRK